jgi:hypothetical protein
MAEDFTNFWSFLDRIVLLNLPVVTEILISLIKAEFFDGVIKRDLLSKFVCNLLISVLIYLFTKTRTEEIAFAAIAIVQDILRLSKSSALIQSARQVILNRSVMSSVMNKIASTKSEHVMKIIGILFLLAS